MAVNTTYSGRYSYHWKATGEAAAFSIRCPFKARRVEVINKTTNSIYVWYPSLGEADATKIVDSGVGTTDISTVTSNGITVKNGGINLGTGVQTTSDDLAVTAWK